MGGNREVIESAVEEEKGLSFTDLKEKTGLSNGVLQYHIHSSDKVIKKKGAVLSEDACDDCRYSDICGSMCVHKELRKETTGKVLEKLRSGESQADIARDLDLTRATVHYHVEKLRDMELVES